ncbi:hypothetical protein M433DRAFT_272351 [Acidomyces richmondensis BFW]|nr:MAG: hypothetical protein FE78DRAFT_424509 [Acidomyces sp. 'richmondensis']KYG45062.1 hypothetical protein M433DRAFT_272351 [Acidomyces richmondensis BFW]
MARSSSQNLPPIRDVFPEDLYNCYGVLGAQSTRYMIPLSPTITNISEETHSFYTPTSSRQPSVSATDVGRSKGQEVSACKQSNASPRKAKPATNYRHRVAASVSSGEKKSKERESRSKQQMVLENGEDAASILCGWQSENLQTNSNGCSSGLIGSKLDNMVALVGYGIQYLNDQLLDAINNGRDIDETKTELCMKLTEKTRFGPLYGTLLYDPDEVRCDHLDRERRCIIHPGQPNSEDWRICRRSRRKAVMDRNFQKHQDQLGKIRKTQRR